ncbi:MAG: hypothetical protein Q4E24_00675 [bacterium]|nr:hypothetical protein [bacterium]
MSQNEYPVSDLDSLTADHRLKMMKAALPYMGASHQRAFSVMIKAQELSNTLQLARETEDQMVGICSVGDQPASTLDMLNAIKPYGTPYEQDFIDVIINFMQGFRLYNSYQETVSTASADGSNAAHPNSFGTSGPQGAASYIEQLKKIMPKEQVGKLENIEMMLSLMQQLSK